jgi:hypothetical protein
MSGEDEIMATKIEVEKTGNLEFRVRIIENGSESTHHVTLKQEDYAKLTGGKTEAEELVRRSFEFLLEHEPKESILSRFDLSVISRYFPEYDSEIRRRLL